MTNGSIVETTWGRVVVVPIFSHSLRVVDIYEDVRNKWQLVAGGTAESHVKTNTAAKGIHYGPE